MSRRSDRSAGRRAAALFRVDDTSLTVAPGREGVVERDGTTVRLTLDSTSPRAFVLERRHGEGRPYDLLDLVPEAVGAIPMLRDTVSRLGEETETVRVRTRGAEDGIRHLSEVTAESTRAEPGTEFRFRDTVFTASVESEQCRTDSARRHNR